MSEGEYPRITFEAANYSASFLERDGITALTFPRQNRHVGIHQRILGDVGIVRSFLDASAQSSGDPRIAALSNTYHHFEISEAASLDDARELLGKYDHLHPHEAPDDALNRKQDLINRWLAVQVLKGRNEDIAQLVPEVTGEQYAMPDGFKVLGVETYPVAVGYSDAPSAQQDLEQYRNFVSPVTNPEKEEVPPEERVYLVNSDGVTAMPVPVAGFSYQEYPGGVTVSSERQYKIYGVHPIEMFAYAVGKPVEYSDLMKVDIEAQVPDIVFGERAVTVPFSQFANIFAAVTGQQEMAMVEEPDLSWPGTVTLDFPGGKIQFSGFDRDGKLGVRDKAKLTFSAQLELGNISNENLTKAAQRLSAWSAKALQK